MLTNITIHWLCRTAGSSIRCYYEDANAEVPEVLAGDVRVFFTYLS